MSDIMSRVRNFCYTVTAETESPDAAEAYRAWLLGGHIQSVIEGGASRGELIQIESEPGDPIRIQSRYIFQSREMFETYEREYASALREEGIRLFGPKSEHPMLFSRTHSNIIAEFA